MSELTTQDSTQSRSVSFFVNGVPRTVSALPDATLLDVLRTDLGLTGTKKGCGGGECGACTVLLDGNPVSSCILPALKAEGRRVETIEGLGTRGELHPLQSWFLKLGAVHCGFCTPGMLMSAKALLDSNPNPSTDQIKAALAGNLCRCTGYAKIVQAVAAAGAELRGERLQERADRTGDNPIGKSVIRVDGVPKVLGAAQFAADLSRPGMLHAAMVVSPHAHALIQAVDTSRALSRPGVVTVLTADDVPGAKTYGILTKDTPFLATGKVRYAGEPVAVVIAEDERVARAAAADVQVTYEPLPAVFDPVEAMESDTVKVHDGGNVLRHVKVRVGDVDEAMAQAAVTANRRCVTQAVDHAYIEPEAGIAYWDGDVLVVHTCSQGTHYMRGEVARMLNMPISRVRIIQATTGGAFGGKIDLSVQHFIALGCYKTGRPVRMAWTREESLRTSTKRHPFVLDYTFGADRSGKLIAAQVKLIGNTGAYASFGPGVLNRAAITALGPYECPNTSVDAYVVYTNTAISGAMRGFGGPQTSTCSEPLLDEIGRMCGLDPVEIRRVNMLRTGSRTLTRQLLTAASGGLEALERVEAEVRRRDAEVRR